MISKHTEWRMARNAHPARNAGFSPPFLALKMDRILCGNGVFFFAVRANSRTSVNSPGSNAITSSKAAIMLSCRYAAISGAVPAGIWYRYIAARSILALLLFSPVPCPSQSWQYAMACRNISGLSFCAWHRFPASHEWLPRNAPNAPADTAILCSAACSPVWSISNLFKSAPTVRPLYGPTNIFQAVEPPASTIKRT